MSLVNPTPAEGADDGMSRDRWSSRASFIIAAIGSAVGLGNVWRFPFLAYSGGGGAFFIPYVLALFLIGMPLLLLELALGQVYQTGDVNAFGRMHKRLRGIGFASVWTGLMVVSYYAVVIAWACVFLVNVGSEPWVGNEDGPVSLATLGNERFKETCKIDEGQLVSDNIASQQFFFVNVIGIEKGRGFECFESGSTYEDRVQPIFGTNCQGEGIFPSNGGFQNKDGNWNRPCYSHDEESGGTCTSDAECEGIRTCDASQPPADPPSDLALNPKLGTCQGPPRDGPTGSCNPCQAHNSNITACWDDDMCYYERGECRTYDYLRTSPLRTGGYVQCLDQAYVPEWGPSFKCPSIPAMNLCGASEASRACPQSCNSCVDLQVQSNCDQGAKAFNGEVFGAVVVVWVVCIACLIFGVKTTGQITYVTMLLPMACVVALFFAGVTLEGAGEGARQYIGKWEMSDLTTNPKIWSLAVGQIFFSIGIGFGIMTAYSSYNSRKQNTVANTVIIAGVDSLVSFVAGFTVFCILGNFAFRQGVSFENLDAIGGMSLAFRTYPVALSKIPGGGVWCGIFFVTLFFLGLDSAFALQEAVVTVIKDSRKFSWIRRQLIVIGVGVFAMIMGVFYCLDNGFYLLDAMDFYLNSVSLVFVGLMQTIAAGWVFGYKEQIDVIGLPAFMTFSMSWLLGVVGGVQLAFWIAGENGTFYGISFGFWVIFGGSAVAYTLAAKLDPTKSGGEVAYDVFLGNIEKLREELNEVVAPPGSKNWSIPMVWGLLIKFFIPPALAIMLGITFQEDFGTYGNYSAKYQIPAIIVSLMTVFFTFLCILFPDLYTPFAPHENVYALPEEERAKLGLTRTKTKEEPRKVEGEPYTSQPAHVADNEL